ncbi:MAG: glycosyltransferase family 4 protein [Exilispira sp.]|nr:glycosyltransferase family 4 protein [Exilispira sp.]
MIKLKNSILIVSFYLFPYNRVGAIRTSLFANFLSSKGHTVYAVQADESHYKNDIDFSLTLNPEIKLSKVKIKTLKNRSINQYKFTISFYKSIDKILKKEKIDCMVFSGGPFYYFILGTIFKKKYKIPYLLDYRDIWYRDKIFKTEPYRGIEKYTDRILEKISVSNADAIIDVTEKCSRLHRKLYQNMDPEKFYTIFNGFDDNFKLESNNKNSQGVEDGVVLSKDKNMTEFNNNNKDIESVANGSSYKTMNQAKGNEISQKNNDLRLGIFGKFAFYNKEDVDKIIALEKLDEAFAKMLFIDVIGKEEPYFINKARESKYIKFNFYGQLNYIEGMKILSSADAFLTNCNYSFALGTKIFDYILLNKPILAFAKEDWEISRLLSSFEYGFVLDNEQDLLLTLKFIKEKKIKYLTKKTEIINQYSRTRQFEKFEDILSKIVQN